MTDEEREAIEWLKRLVKLNKRNNLDDTFAEILLNLIEEMKKQLDLDIECEIALNSKIMDSEKEIEELKEKAKRQWVLIKENGKVEPLFYVSEDKIKAKIEIIKEEKENCKDSIEEKYLLREIYVLHSLLEKE